MLLSYCVLVFFLHLSSVNSLFLLNGQTCKKIFDLNFKVRTLKCPFRGDGIYIYADSDSVLPRIELDRISLKTIIYVPESASVKEIVVIRNTGNVDNPCGKFNVPKETKVVINDAECVSICHTSHNKSL